MARKKTEPHIEPELPAVESKPDTTAAEPKKPRRSLKALAESAVSAAQALVAPKPARRRAKAEQPVLIEETAPEPEPEPEKKPARSRKKATEAPKPEFPAIVDEDGSFVVLEWRPLQRSLRPEPSEGAPTEGGRRSRRRGRRRGGAAEPVLDGEATEPDALEEFGDDLGLSVTFRSTGAGKPEEPVVPERPVRKRREPPVRPAVPVPDDAPRVAVLNGIPTIVKNHRAYPPIFFFGNSSDERRAATVEEEMRMAGEAGIHLHCHLIELEVDEATVDASANFAAYLLGQSIRTDPDAQVFFRVLFVPPRNWQATFPDAAYNTSDGMLADPSICDDAFWGVANKCLELFVRKMRLAQGSEHVMGLHLDRAEWFVPEGRGYDTSNGALKKFREWAETRYSDDEVMLRAAWFDGRASFDNLTIPLSDEPHHDGDRFVRASRKQRRYVDYHLFLSDATAARIGELAYTVKATSEGYYLVGASYGYTFEWSHPASGHLALGKLLRTREVDIIGGPPSYRNREPGGSAAFPCPVDSVSLNGKLFISEEDFKTKLGADHHEPDDFNPIIKTPQALEGVHWRGAGEALAHGGGVCWMDLWGNGWLKTPAIWSRAGKVAQGMARRLGSPLKDPDVAVFIDERALAYLVDTEAFTFLVQNVRECVLRSGLSAGFFLLSDLSFREKFPDAKLYLFLNAWDIRPELRAAIKNRLQQDGKVLFWLYAAGLFDGGRESLERAREVTGIALKPQPFHSKSGTTVLNRRHPLCGAFPDRGLVGGTKLEPSYFAIPEDALVLGEYTQTGLPSFVIKEFGQGDPSSQWTSVFLGEPTVSPGLIRALGQLAGAHVYDFHEDVVHVNPPFLTVHCASAGPRTLTLPPNWSAYDLQGGTYEPTEANSIRFNAAEGSTRNFLIGPQAELEGLVGHPIDDLLTVGELPEADPNTLDDHPFFDIPIMKLGEWMEGDLSEEAAEEWLLRPPTLDAPVEAADEGAEARPGRRRRRRRGQGGGDRHGSEEVVAATGSDSDDEFPVSVTFRKRE
ncbi:MAG TPA: hypothetical protein VKT78_01360 [Fimbriimonadaceae bacterium]|nr:hypothetical protein [Fimbriimonadaceae bacterium]